MENYENWWWHKWYFCAWIRSMSMVRVRSWNLWSQFNQHADIDSCGPLQSHLSTLAQSLHYHCSTFRHSDRSVVAVGSHLGHSAAARMGQIHRRRISGTSTFSSFLLFRFFFMLLYGRTRISHERTKLMLEAKSVEKTLKISSRPKTY